MPNLSELERWMGTGQVADKLGYTRQYVINLAKEKKIRAVKTGAGWLYDPDSVEIFDRHRDKGNQWRGRKPRSTAQVCSTHGRIPGRLLSAWARLLAPRFTLHRVSGLSKLAQESRRADSNRLPLLITSELLWGSPSTVTSVKAQNRASAPFLSIPANG
jgi:hypothetical protein